MAKCGAGRHHRTHSRHVHPTAHFRAASRPGLREHRYRTPYAWPQARAIGERRRARGELFSPGAVFTAGGSRGARANGVGSETQREMQKGPGGVQVAQRTDTMSDASAPVTVPEGDGSPGEMSLEEFLRVKPENGDGYLTLGEAKWQWRYGEGQPITVDADKLDLSGLRASNFPRGVGSTTKFTLPRWKDFMVHGTITVKLEPNGVVSITPDKFNFDMKPWKGYWLRNLQTVALRLYVGSGKEFDIFFRGTVPVPP
ncbi:hypothetical protein HRbin30_00068 [bacterium HR30]|nr:hypothetical protein HRbin30_00068 [bacterium HR30]